MLYFDKEINGEPVVSNGCPDRDGNDVSKEKVEMRVVL